MFSWNCFEIAAPKTSRKTYVGEFSFDKFVRPQSTAQWTRNSTTDTFLKVFSYYKTTQKFPFQWSGDSPSTGCSATKFALQTIFERCFENVRKCFMKSSAVKFLFSKLQSFKLQPLALRVLKTTEILEIAPTVKFFFVVADTDRFSTE